MKIRDYQKYIDENDIDYTQVKTKKKKTKKPLNAKDWIDEEQSFGKKNTKGKKWKNT